MEPHKIKTLLVELHNFRSSHFKIECFMGEIQARITEYLDITHDVFLEPMSRDTQPHQSQDAEQTTNP